jgi:uncharacterized membrane protein YvbJ
MKVCNNCGATINDNASYCNNCGANIPANYSAYSQVNTKTPVSVGGWIGRSLIPCIPLVGGIVYLIMLFIWSGDQTKEDTFRNWAKAQLIVMAVVVVLGIILAVVLGSVFSEALRYMQ